MAQGHGANFILNFMEVKKLSRLLTLFCEALLDLTSVYLTPGMLPSFCSSNILYVSLLQSSVLAGVSAWDSLLCSLLRHLLRLHRTSEIPSLQTLRKGLLPRSGALSVTLLIPLMAVMICLNAYLFVY